ncbi:MAG: tetratricopeptide repeat protein, partial [Rhodospirillaceae bacterium]
AFFAAILRAPAFAEAYNSLGVTLATRGNGEDAVFAFRRAVTERPDWIEARLNLAAILAQCHQPEAAYWEYRELAQHHPGNGHFQFLAGTAALSADFLDEADTLLRRALLHSPRDAGIMNNLGLVLGRLGHVSDAVRSFRQAVALKPDYVEAWFGLAAALDSGGEIEEAAAIYDQVARLRPDDPGTDSNRLMALNYRDTLTAEEVGRRHRHWGERRERPCVQSHKLGAMPAVPRSVGRRLRLGYVSPDFRLHSVAMFLLPLLDHHNRDRFEIFAYSNVDKPDVITEQVRTSVDHWRGIQDMPDEAVVRQVRDDGIDVLIDLAGHTARNRLGVFAHRPAPVQISWLGYPATTGLAVIDARFTDAVADPVGAADLCHSERLIRLDGGFLCYRPLSPAPAPELPPCLAQGFVTFGSFNTLNKVSASTAALWARVLRAIPGSRLLLKTAPLADATVRNRVCAMFAAHGIPSDRLQLLPRIPNHNGHLAAYGRIDIALDPTPYNGTTTSCEAMWMGVPVLTLAGDRHAARVGASLLTAAGLTDWIATDEDDFVHRATSLAADPEHLVSTRQSLRSGLQSSSLCKGPAFAREFERQCFQLIEETNIFSTT